MRCDTKQPGSGSAAAALIGGSELRRSLGWMLLALGMALLPAAGAAPVLVVPLEGAIGPASAEFVRRALQRAAREQAPLVVLRMDTPGGLDSAMREIIKEILASKVPVAGFVAPSGSRAASAGTFILYASHVAAMAPGTNLGAASPVAIGGPAEREKPGDDKADNKGKASSPADTMMRKATNDAVAYIRGFAQLRGRNAEWAERAVREAVSLPAEEALKIRVIDLMAADVGALLQQLDGRTIDAGGQKRVLHTADAALSVVEIDWRTRLLGAITNPSIAYLLVLIGVYALLFEFMNPGLILPGVVGAISLLIALYAFQLLPVNYAGLALMVLGIGLMVAETFVPAFGSLGVGGLAAFVIGSVILFDESELPGLEIPLGVIAGAAVASGAFLFFVLGLIWRGRRRPVVSGRESLIGASGVALADFTAEGWARVQGETWRVRSPVAVRQGERLRVEAIEGLVLTVRPEQENK